MRLLLLIIIPVCAYGGFSDVSRPYAYKKPLKSKNYKKPSLNNDLNEKISRLLEQDKKIAEYFKAQEQTLNIKKKPQKILSLTRSKGIILNSVLAMNIKPSTFIVRITENDDLLGGELRCLGVSFNKRVPSKCNLLVLDETEYEVDISLWDLDGADGIISDYFYTGQEKAFLTSSFASFLGSSIEASKGGINTPIGIVSDNTAKNKVLDGILGITANAKDKLKSSGQQNIEISYINSGKEVLIFFNKTLSLKKDSR